MNTGRHLEDSFTKGKKDTYLIPRVLYLSQAISHWELMQRVKASGGLERHANRSTVPNDAASDKVLLQDTLHTPDLCLTVMSIGRTLKVGYTVQFAGNSCDIKKGEDGCIIGYKPLAKIVRESNAISAEPASTFSRFIAGDTIFQLTPFALLFALVPSPEFV